MFPAIQGLQERDRERCLTSVSFFFFFLTHYLVPTLTRLDSGWSGFPLTLGVLIFPPQRDVPGCVALVMGIMITRESEGNRCEEGDLEERNPGICILISSPMNLFESHWFEQSF